ncbi:hypothetical protein Bhyg_04018 [Pseudolycoriella hygida]|uniref:DUF753 domain-containing protein n=1 Tax=Pseudolycoriella hygida TaxID=35572 RepID=A0A9Q0S813_9DIPT|nr:hypothetical protein Bhyg_04018 [Pseudolycoriella hygida]
MLVKLLVGVLLLGLGELVPNVYSLQCISCSSANTAACATTSGTLPSIDCAEGSTSCYTYVEGEVTIRSCALPEVNPPSTYSTCSGDNCNSNIYPENRLSCHKCVGVGCLVSNDLPTPTPCQRYKEDDECFTYLYNGVATRGCLSESEAMVTNCLNEHICSKCTSGGCNGKSIEDEECVVCDSEIDINCVSNLNETMQKVCPATAAGMGCYRFDDGGGMVKRGCLSSLLTYEVDECRREGETCKTCVGNNCNAKVNFEKCRVCNSSTNVNCIRSPTSVTTSTCRNYLDTCFSHVENNVVTRGCVLDQPTAVQTECARTSSDLCETCTGTSNCNNKIIDGEFCMDCDSQEDPNCRTSLNHTMRVQCNLAIKQLGCYLYDDGGDIVKRGCINNDLHPGEVSMCRQQGQFCKTCIGNDCNTKLTFQRCQSCDSTTNVNCIRSAGSVGEITCRDYMDTCYVHVRDDIVMRGCVSQSSTSIQTECRRNNSDFCETCNENNCNNLLIDGEFCLTCDSQVDPLCVDTLNHTMRTQCNLGVRRLGCYRYDDGGDIIKRGCLSHLIPEEITYCRNQGQFCKTCIGDDCNAKIDFQECKVCNSTQNVDCIRSTHYIGSTVCRNYLDECFVHVDDNNVILRGCLQQNPTLESDCRDPDICESCDDRANCNDKIVDGEFCMTCDSTVDPNCVSNLNVSMRTQCNLAVTRMGCYLFDDGGEIIKRGCLSDIHPDEVTMCRQEGQFCKTCMGNDCNTKPAFQECKVCNSSQNVDCIRSTHYINSVTCRDYLDECFVHVQGNITTRGCLKQTPSLTTECQNRDICQVCDDRDDCNDKIVDGEFCITCDSQVDPNCRNNLNVTMRTQCSLSVEPMGCYLYDDGGDIIKRGCLSDLIAYEVAMCRQQGQFCKTCLGNDCNTKLTFQRCQSCNSSSNVNCIRSGGTVGEITCRDYMDTCYVHVRNDIVTRGCVAQPSTPTEVQTECRRTNSDFCETCIANNCNDLLIDGEFCLTCDSQVNPLCRDTLNHTMRTQCNLGVRRLGCYRYDDGGDIIIRGCLSHLIPEEITYCRNQGQFCKTCIGDDCNAKIDFQACRVCNSSQGVECIRSATGVSSQVCRNYLDECFTHVQNNITVRGCLQQNPSLAGDCQNRDICESCDHRGNCNDQIVDGEFCITCDSQLDPNCIDNVNFTMRTQCSLTVNGMGCYLFDDGGDIIKRGCLSDLIPYEVSMCRQEGTFCKTCQGNDCNSQLRFQRCLSCDSMTNPDCLLPNENVPSALCRNYKDSCMTHFENNRVIRGCASQRSDLQLSCLNNSSLCITCNSGANCNTDPVEEEFCITCDSENDVNCRTSPNITMIQQCGADVKLNKMGCYRFDDSGDIVKRGCLEDLVAGEIQMCRREGSECKTCMGNNCNLKAKFQSCHTCNSETNINCVSLKEAPPTTVCRNYLDECKTVTLVGGRTERGCSSQLNVIGNIISYECADENCNSNIFPPRRIACHQCSGSQCSGDLSTNAAFASVCRNYDANDRCFAFVDESREMRRGCESDITEDRSACNDANERCVLCNGSNCNTAPAITQSSLSCIKCSNSNQGCAWGHASTDAISCSPSVVFPNVESCFTYEHGNRTVTRGCSLDDPLCADDAAGCRSCSGNGCNIQNVITQSCKVCRSDQQAQCGSEAFTGLEELCGAIVTYEKRGCYSKREDGVIIRGCAASLSSNEITECADEGNDQCIYCDVDNCNIQALSHATSLKSILSVVLAIFVANLIIR